VNVLYGPNRSIAGGRCGHGFRKASGMIRMRTAEAAVGSTDVRSEFYAGVTIGKSHGALF
jgi:hypothetical protein